VTLALVVGAIGWGAGGALLADRGAGGAGGPGGEHGGGSGAAGRPGSSAGGGSASGGAGPSDAAPAPTPKPPTGGTELYGYLPYWEMTDQVQAYLRQVPVQTLALFSVGVTSSGGIKQKDTGYQRITGARGASLIAEAHGRGQRVELVFTSFGYAANARLFGDDPKAVARRTRAARELADLAAVLGVDGMNVDVELIDGDYNDGYVGFLGDLGSRLRAGNPQATLTVASTTGHGGADRARAALAAGVDRIFLMGYDYHWSGSGAGASSPIQSRDGTPDLEWSIGAYVDAGVPRDRIILGLPLYGMSWPVAGPVREAAVTGKGSNWIPAKHLDVLLAPGFTPWYDFEEVADYFVTPTASGGWTATYYDSPRSLRPKLELARSQGLAGAGFWALGYDLGLPGYSDLMAQFVAGKIGG
jgi:hypothetical protein